MKRIARFLLVASLLVPPGTGYAMTIEQMKQLRGADLLELRVDEIFTKCGLPDVIADHSVSSSLKKDIQWNNIKMNLSDDGWDLLYRNSRDTGTKSPVTGWTNPGPVKSRCFSDFSLVTLFTQGGAGILNIDKKQHKTTYTMPESLYKAHKVIGYKASLITPLSFAEITRTYGRNDETVAKDKNNRIIRYWVLVESSQMPVALYAVDFEINNIDNTCVAYRVVTSEYDFVRSKFEEFTEMWDRYGID
jgi:hypothetical protein